MSGWALLLVLLLSGCAHLPKKEPRSERRIAADHVAYLLRLEVDYQREVVRTGTGEGEESRRELLRLWEEALRAVERAAEQKGERGQR